MKASPGERARAYLASVPGAVSGSGGHAATFHVACILVQGFDMTPEQALPLLLEWNAICQPPWTVAELQHKLADASKVRAAKPRGYLLGDEIPAASAARPLSSAVPQEPERPLPDRCGFTRGTAEQIRRLAALRPYHREGLGWANGRGVLTFGLWHGVECHGVTDASGRLLEIRRMDGQPFSPVPGASLGERKSHAVRGSQKAWPVGIIEAREFPAIALVEGVPDFLTAHHVALWEQASHHGRWDVRCAPVAMLSASPLIHADALQHFVGKIVRLYPHADGAGLRGAVRWQTQLQHAGAARVDVFDFSPYRTEAGSTLNDLWELEHELGLGQRDRANLWRILP